MKILISSRSRRTTRPLSAGAGDGGATNRAIRVVAQPQVDALCVKQMLTIAKLLEFLVVGESRQAYRTLTADLLHVRVLLVPKFSNSGGGDNAVSVARLTGVIAGVSLRSPETRRTAVGEDEGVDYGGDCDHGNDGEEEFERREVEGARTARKRRRRGIEHGNLRGGERGSIEKELWWWRRHRRRWSASGGWVVHD
ncbi:hypothetical protein PIB30_042339 [Stylosanthes scabra]|uniref:Uncharacterized protein n=1 Tax=Stylosanthes scabra TaxID=79078 RepID=A0ABU6SFD9_9FABA|nr:hypothetical protein [Stylosanthes scabra]